MAHTIADAEAAGTMATAIDAPPSSTKWLIKLYEPGDGWIVRTID